MHRNRQNFEKQVAREEVSCPLSVAVFGPPGSGKSHCVREIVGSIPDCSKPFLVNLSQLANPKDLAEAFTRTLENEKRDKDKPKTTVFFFDEFDAPLNGVSLGWLRWFLAPMQDGKFFFEGRSISIGKAVLMFAGGTAESLKEFGERALSDPAEYREKKVPDFISRLRGFIDIQGINNLDGERWVRRAIVLRHLLDKRWPKLRDANGVFPIDSETVCKLLSNVHFVHGARSMEALLDMCRLTKTEPKEVQLPQDNDLKLLHLSRGLLDGKTIGISAGQRDFRAKALLLRLAGQLLRHGANLAYGGDFIPDGTLHQVVHAAEEVPDELVERRDNRRIRNYQGFPSFHSTQNRKHRSQEEHHVEFLELHTLSEAKLEELRVPRRKWFPALPMKKSDTYHPKHHLAWALSLFRMRARLMEDIHALVVLGGKDDGQSWGRFSGIAEEVMLALALRKPVYVLGGLGGAALAVGRLLGLDTTVADPERCLMRTGSLESALKETKYAFAFPGISSLPQNIKELRDFLFQRSMTTPAWPWNGLTPDENRELFSTPLQEKGGNRCVDMIVQGLLRLDWKAPAGSPTSGRATVQANRSK